MNLNCCIDWPRREKTKFTGLKTAETFSLPIWIFHHSMSISFEMFWNLEFINLVRNWNDSFNTKLIIFQRISSLCLSIIHRFTVIMEAIEWNRKKNRNFYLIAYTHTNSFALSKQNRIDFDTISIHWQDASHQWLLVFLFRLVFFRENVNTTLLGKWLTFWQSFCSKWISSTHTLLGNGSWKTPIKVSMRNKLSVMTAVSQSKVNTNSIWNTSY